MPRCEGRAGGVGITLPCPDDRCDDSVRSRQGDLFLCDACMDDRFPPAAGTAQKDRLPAVSKPKRGPGLPEPSKRKSKKGDNISSSALPVPGSAGACSNIADANVSVLGSQPSQTPATQVNELLSYVNFYRDRSNLEDLRKVILRFFNPVDVSDAKRMLIQTLQTFIPSDCQFISDRRNSAGRLAHHAELDDIFGIMDELDARNLLSATQFSAINIAHLPKCAPEDLNFCAVAERQQQTEAVVQELVSAIAELSPKSNDGLVVETENEITSTLKAVESLNNKLSESLSHIQSQLDHLSEVYKHSFKSLHPSQVTQSARPTSPPVVANQPVPAADIDRSRNVVVFGIPEDRNFTIWQKQVLDVLAFVAGPLQVGDVFRLGRYETGKTRPVLVRLSSVWDRRLILSNASCLRDDVTWNDVFIRPDVSLPECRRRSLKYIHTRAEQRGKLVSLDNDDLYVDNVLLFSVSRGWVVGVDNAVRVSLFSNNINTNGCA